MSEVNDPCPGVGFVKTAFVDRSTHQHIDGLIMALVDDPMQFSLEVGNINKEMVFLLR